LGCDKRPKPYKVGKGLEARWRGVIIEDVWLDIKEDETLPPHKKYETWEPHIQAIKSEEGDFILRFCYWKRNPDGSRGRFIRVPMHLYEWNIKDLVEEAKKCRAEIVLMLLRKFVE
jgi:hypothetical protein